MIENKIKEIIGKVVGEDVSNFNLEDINMKNLINWDSLAHLKIVIALEEEFDIEIEPDEIGLMKSGAVKIKEIIEKRNNEK